MSITVAEKEHWKARIQAKLSRKIDRLKRTDSALFQAIDKQAHQAALDQLAITDDYHQLDTLRANLKAQEQQVDELLSRLHEQLTGQKKQSCYGLEREITTIIKRHQDEAYEDLLGEHELGRQIRVLESEKENLLDTVWLATSSRQVRDLWEKVAQLLGDEATPIQKDILSTEQDAS